MPGETRQQILEACQKLIQTLGLARVTTKEIAKASGLSEGALYRHFEHKEDVFLAVFEKQVVWLADFLSAKVAGQGDVAENFRQIAFNILRYYEQLIPLTAAFFADNELLEKFRGLLQQIGGPQRLHQWVATYIAEEQALGRVAATLPAMNVATSLLGPVFQYAFLRQLTNEDQFGLADRQFVEKQVEILLAGILP
jgi:AcrR family transcriptional regulator